MASELPADLSLAVIGSGVMAEAVITRLLDRGVVEPGAIACADPRPERLVELSSRYGIRPERGNVAAAAGAQLVLLAVKPQALGAVLRDLHGRLGAEQLVLSIVAGASTAALAAGLSHSAVVRLMPNTPAQGGEGMTVWFAPAEVDERGRALVRGLAGLLGDQLEVGDERLVTLATAISGSGPAYVFLFAEALVGAGVALGLPRPEATRLALQTIRGSAAFALSSDRHLGELRDLVTSPGGTTAAALRQLERGALRAAVDDAVRAAHQRTLELERQADAGAKA